MSRLDELIQQYCPDGVAYVALETVCLISKGIQFNKKDMHDEGTYDCGSFVVNETAVVGKEPKKPYNRCKSTQKGANSYEISI